MFDTTNGFDTQSLRLIGALKFDPGYLLLCDMLQAELDNLTDELAARDLPSSQTEGKLRYWQAFRDITRRIKTEPETFSAQQIEENPDSVPDDLTIAANTWATLRQQSNPYAYPDPPALV